MKIIYFFALVFFNSLLHSSDMGTVEEFWRDEIKRSLSNYRRYLSGKQCCVVKVFNQLLNTPTHQTIQRKLVQAKELIDNLKDPQFERENITHFLNQMSLTDEYEIDLQKGCSALIRVDELTHQRHKFFPSGKNLPTIKEEEGSPERDVSNSQNKNDCGPPPVDIENPQKNICFPAIDEKDSRICTVCMEHDSYEFSLPCGHPTPCNSCINSDLYSSRKKECMYCRGNIESTIKHEKLLKCTNCEKNYADVYYTDCKHVILCEKCEKGYCDLCKKEKTQEKKIKLFFVN